MRAQDLRHLDAVRNGGLVYPGNPPISITPQQAIAQGDSANVSRLDFGSHTARTSTRRCTSSTSGAGVDALPLDVLMGRARLIAVRRRRDERSARRSCGGTT